MCPLAQAPATFSFCGMMLEPVQKASSMSTKSNSGVDQMSHSSARRGRCSATKQRSPTNSMTKSRSLAAS